MGWAAPAGELREGVGLRRWLGLREWAELRGWVGPRLWAEPRRVVGWGRIGSVGDDRCGSGA